MYGEDEIYRPIWIDTLYRHKSLPFVSETGAAPVTAGVAEVERYQMLNALRSHVAERHRRAL
jgi:hypothetical protein